MSTMRFLLVIFIFAYGVLFAQNGSWWEPEFPQSGDTITIYFDPTQNSEIPNNVSSLVLHWGVNELSAGAWQTPPAYLWPPGTVLHVDGIAARTPMTQVSATLWKVRIPTDSTIYSLHYVVNDGTPSSPGSHWGHNVGGSNWNIYLEQPQLVEFLQTFVIDNRSYFLTYLNKPIVSGYLKGSFNGWGNTLDTLKVSPDPEVLYTRVMLPAGRYEYKFHVNGLGTSDWLTDPDNPLSNSANYNNSILLLFPDSTADFYDVLPEANQLFTTSDVINFEAYVQPGNRGRGMLPGSLEVTLNGTPVSFSYQQQQRRLSGSLGPLTEGDYILSFTGVDSGGVAATPFYRHFRVVSSLPSGIYEMDAAFDDVGAGSFRYPVGVTSGAADLRNFQLQVNASLDTLQFTVELDTVTENSRVALYLYSDGLGLAVPAEENVNLWIREWDGNGVFIPLMHPQSPYFNAARDNRVYISRQPLQADLSLHLDAAQLAENRFLFQIPLAYLETYLGTFNTDWYATIIAYLMDGQGTIPVTQALGGDSLGRNPNIYDAMFLAEIKSVDYQKRLLSNYNNVHPAMLDAENRGMLRFTTEMLQPGWVNQQPVVSILTQDAWTTLPDKFVRGTVSDPAVTEVIVNHNGQDITVPVSGGEWNLTVNLVEGENIIQARATNNFGTGYSTQLVVTRWVDHYPKPEVTFALNGNQITLDASVSTDPDNDIAGYHWEVDANNPEPISITNPDMPVISFLQPTTEGEYYFNLTVTDQQGNSAFKRTFVRVTADSVSLYDWNESAGWLQDAIVYEIFVRSFSDAGNFQGVLQRLDYLQELGINTIWFNPIHESPDDHGYSVMDYYSIESDFGTLADFQQLVNEAHVRGMRVMIDHVVNHTSLFHPFAADMLRYLEDSQYWKYYEKELIGNTNGLGWGFYPSTPPYIYTYYSNWWNLPNLDLGYPDARKYFIDMAKWWVAEIGVDGYRCDVAWGPLNRGYNYWPDWRKALKDIKPETILLGELNASDFYVFDHRFDVAYDWPLHHGTGGYTNIDWNNPNLTQLHNLITNYGYWTPPYKYPLRFLENFDEGRYIAAFGVEKTRLIAALNMSIPGIPLIYAGQEVGEMTQRGRINWSDPHHLLPFYQRLTRARRDVPALRRGDFQPLTLIAFNQVYSFLRQKDSSLVFALFNFKNQAQDGWFSINPVQYGLQPGRTYFLNDVASGESIQTTGSGLNFQAVHLEPYQPRVFVLSDTAMFTDIEEPQASTPYRFELAQNYPNPFNPSTTIEMEVPQVQHVEVVVYNILGQKVRVLTDRTYFPGRYRLQWDGRNEQGLPVASGIYIVQMRAGDVKGAGGHKFVKSRRMVLLR